MKNLFPHGFSTDPVIGADGSLTGYAGGLEVKRALLDLEGGILSFACSDIQAQAEIPVHMLN